MHGSSLLCFSGRESGKGKGKYSLVKPRRGKGAGFTGSGTGERGMWLWLLLVPKGFFTYLTMRNSPTRPPSRGSKTTNKRPQDRKSSDRTGQCCFFLTEVRENVNRKRREFGVFGLVGGGGFMYICSDFL